MKNTPDNQRGIARVGLIALSFAVFIIMAFIGSVLLTGKNNETDSDSQNQAAQNQAADQTVCSRADEIICKFQAAWKNQNQYIVRTKTTGGSVQGDSMLMLESSTRFRVSSSGDVPYEMITIDGASYTRAANGVWWKRAVSTEESRIITGTYNYTDTDATTASQTSYQKLGIETCGSRTCHKYQVVSGTDPDSKVYIWFDTASYQLRQTRSELKDGTVTESTFSYEQTNVEVPGPVRDLAPNQYILPGSSEPVTMTGVSS